MCKLMRSTMDTGTKRTANEVMRFRAKHLGMMCVAIVFATGAGSGATWEHAALFVKRVTPPVLSEPRVLDDDPCWPLDQEGVEISRTLELLRTRDARQLVWVMQNSRSAYDRLTLHLAIAHAETRGRILAVSESGAAGLAQATPIAILGEGVEGPLLMSEDYIRGAEAYFLKKPLGDADSIASFLLAGGAREQASSLLDAAWRLRREGLEELDLLQPWADEAFFERREIAEEENAAALQRLGALIEKRASLDAIKRFRDQTRARYRELRNVQRAGWRAYRDELSMRRDELLQEIYGVDASRVMQAAPYDAGEILASRLDVRFSPSLMADFLAHHLDTKRREAIAMGVSDEDIERVAIGLYNSGTPNMKRMIAGLIGSLPETDAYMRRVPGVRDELDGSR